MINENLFLALVFHLYDFFAAIRSAILANAMRENHFAALGASDHSRHIESFLCGTSLIATSRGHLSLRYCHFNNPPELLCIFYFYFLI